MCKPSRPPAHCRPFTALALGLLGSLALVGCGNMMVSATEAQVRFVDTSVDAPALDLYLNGTGTAYNLGFATFSSYVPVGSGTYQLNANRAGTAQALASTRAALAAGHQYTAVVSNRLGDLQEHLYNDALPNPVPGTVALRVLNEVQGNSAVDVYAVGNGGSLASAAPLVTNVAYGLSSGYVRVPAGGRYVLYAMPAGTSPAAGSAVKVSGATVSGSSGAARTLILTEPAAKDGKGLYGIVLEDADGQ